MLRHRLLRALVHLGHLDRERRLEGKRLDIRDLLDLEHDISKPLQRIVQMPIVIWKASSERSPTRWDFRERTGDL